MTPKIMEGIYLKIVKVYVCVKFHENISTDFMLQSGHGYTCMMEIIIYDVQRAVTPKVGKPEL